MICDLNMFITEKGLFLVKDTDFDNFHLENLIKTPEPEEYTDSKINSLLSNVDYRWFGEFLRDNEVNKKLCHQYISSLHVLKQFRNIYSKLIDLHGSKIIVYSDQGFIQFPTCVKINEISITD